jgi:hypothetical protein
MAMRARDSWLALAATLLLVLIWIDGAGATPLYTVREGRTCDNCHALPNDWVDPPEMARRKCTLSCSGCHVDPGGGGLRTVSGGLLRAFDPPDVLGRRPTVGGQESAW